MGYKIYPIIVLMATYKEYAEQSGLTIPQVRQAVKQLFSDYKRKAASHEPRRVWHTEKPPQENFDTCGIITASGKRCVYPARYNDGLGGKVCGIHRPHGYNMSSKAA